MSGAAAERLTHDPKAGKAGLSGYRGGCKCDACRAAHAALMRRYRHNRLGVLPWDEYLRTIRKSKADLVHGIRSTYINSGCRCDKCKGANTAHTRERRNAKRPESIVGVDYHDPKAGKAGAGYPCCHCPRCQYAYDLGFSGCKD